MGCAGALSLQRNRDASFRHPTLSFVKLGAFMTLLQEQTAHNVQAQADAEPVAS